MAQIQSPETYVDGQQVTAARLNNQTNGATLLPGAITDQSALAANTVDVADTILIHDASAGALRKATVSDLMNSGISGTTGTITGSAGVDINITPAGTQKTQINSNLTVTGNETINGSLTVTGNTICDAALTVNGIPTFTTTSALKLPVGTTGQRPGTPALGQIRYNTTTSNTEIYNGTTWEEVGGGPFDATGGNKIIAPDTTVVTASFTSANGESVVVTSGGHSVSVGQIVRIVTAVAGYAGDYQVIAADAGTFTYVMPVLAVANSGSCTYQKAGNFKCHTFTTSGTFTVSGKGGNVEVLVVGGGGGGGVVGSFPYSGGGGGGGAAVYYPYYNLTPGQVVNITVGTGGAASTSGTASTFGTISAGGGTGGIGATGGNSGTGTLASPSNSGNTYTHTTSGGATLSRNGGGGGAGGPAPTNGTGTFNISTSGQGGQGRGSSISGVPVNYGGGGACSLTLSGPVGNGGGWNGNTYVPPIANSGGGGGSQSAGAAGIVIVRYPYWL
jgi:hypothetical protein